MASQSPHMSLDSNLGAGAPDAPSVPPAPINTRNCPDAADKGEEPVAKKLHRQKRSKEKIEAEKKEKEEWRLGKEVEKKLKQREKEAAEAEKKKKKEEREKKKAEARCTTSAMPPAAVASRSCSWFCQGSRPLRHKTPGARSSTPAAPSSLHPKPPGALRVKKEPLDQCIKSEVAKTVEGVQQDMNAFMLFEAQSQQRSEETEARREQEERWEMRER
ncbi:hypothetical protein BDK51DRAFT_44510 [Blyttiomyces helicus]|uniref:Uncharacterized protein n=1 Tax=Blyttiomyces helicus TaxID=388810 RepID=A0A4P9W3H5_9FUNG|nr:hypothetical protein BDK51DRAFT_44510 [Blyttiomyces helicus]|eukprot:RKO86684.1 hypothetical protein BDK51DRAFT_44510 [Blyttiomyces helicus]